MERRVTIHSKRLVFDGFFKIEEANLSYQRFDGEMTPPLTRLSFERGDSVAAIVFHLDSEKLLFTKQFKYPTYQKGSGWMVETMAGMIDHGEAPAQAVRRELMEELGYEPVRILPIAKFYVSPGGSSERIFLHYAEVHERDKKGPGGGLASEDEDIETVAYSPGQLDAAISSGEIEDAKTIIGIQWWQRYFNEGKVGKHG